MRIVCILTKYETVKTKPVEALRDRSKPVEAIREAYLL
jgi:hypothetical protein